MKNHVLVIQKGNTQILKIRQLIGQKLKSDNFGHFYRIKRLVQSSKTIKSYGKD